MIGWSNDASSLQYGALPAFDPPAPHHIMACESLTDKLLLAHPAKRQRDRDDEAALTHQEIMDVALPPAAAEATRAVMEQVSVACHVSLHVWTLSQMR